MKVLLIYPNIAKTLQIPMGIAYISSYLKENGVDTFLWDGTFHEPEALHGIIKYVKPDVVCFSAMSPDYNFVENLAIWIRGFTKVPFVIGGHHATFRADEIWRTEVFDHIIIGEAEYALLSFMKGVKDNMYTKEIVKGELVDVNTLPWPDHEMFKEHFTKQLNWVLGKNRITGIFLTARGCPFKCTYCSCSSLAKIYGKNITRYRDIDDIIDEVSIITQRYKMNAVWFTDETFTINKKRTIELCRKYKDKIGIPFSIETRPDTVNEEVLIALKEAGCETIRMGIESGVDSIRNGLYKRNMSRKTILNAFHTANRLGINTSSFNICGAPTEDMEDVRKTISLNVECNVQSGKMTLLSVFPGTPLEDYCIENGYRIREEYPTNYYIDSNLEDRVLSIDQLMELQNEFKEAISHE